ncbi:MAG: indole-3-glycerol phosphate synthase TrpC [Actinomycetota bacterium]
MSFIQKVTAERREDAGGSDLRSLEEAVTRARPARDFAAACIAPPLKLVAEIKRASPAKGPIDPRANALEIARDYELGGASAISVLTEERYFRGSLNDLSVVANGVELPVLRKDFICEPAHVLEARAAGADAVLLIVAGLAPNELKSLTKLTHELGMTADIEVHDEAEVDTALDAGARVIAINARNLATLEVDLAQIERVRPRIPNGIVVIAESGIASREDVQRMRNAGVDAVHIGELLMRSPDKQNAVAELMR